MMERRAFVVNVLTALAAGPSIADAGQAVEVPTYWADVPSGATLWGLVVFTADEPVEVTIAAGKEIKTIRGHFEARRLTEYSWRNTGSSPQRVAIRAKAMAGDRELAASKVQFLAEQNIYVAFGRRATPDRPAERRGGYPFEAVFVGFFVFEA